MARTSDALLPLREAFEEAVAQVLGAAMTIEEPPDGLAGLGIDFIGRVADATLAVEIKAAPTIADVHRLASVGVPSGAYKVLVGGRISRAVRTHLHANDMGFYDARGHLRLMHPPLFVDAPAPSIGADASGVHRDPLAHSWALDVALCLLDEPDFLERSSLRRLAGELGRAPSTVSTTLRALRDDHLLDDGNRPVVPDLFQAVLPHWRPVRVPLADAPDAGGGRLAERLQIGFDDDLSSPGWAVAAGHAAAEWGAPVVVLGDTPPDFYVPDKRVLSLARATFGTAVFGDHACTAAVAPAPFVVRNRSHPLEHRRSSFPVVRPVVAALDLASDPGRGRETLELWNESLDAWIQRVW